MRPWIKYARWKYHKRIARLREEFPHDDLPPTCDFYSVWRTAEDLDRQNGSCCTCDQLWLRAAGKL